MMTLADDVREPLIDAVTSTEAVTAPEIDGEGEAEGDIEEDVDMSPLPLGDALVVSTIVKLEVGVAPLERLSEAVGVSVSRGE